MLLDDPQRITAYVEGRHIRALKTEAGARGVTVSRLMREILDEAYPRGAP